MLRKVDGCALWLNPHDVSGVVISKNRNTYNAGEVDHTIYLTLRSGGEMHITVPDGDLEGVWKSLHGILTGPEKPGDERF